MRSDLKGVRRALAAAPRVAAATLVTAVIAALTVFVLSNPASAGPAPVIFGYVPLPTDQFRDGMFNVNNTVDTTVRFTVGITNAGDGSVIYYDHWEDGFEADIANPVQSTTLVWGDGNLANGDATTVCAPACAGDLLTAGDVFVLRNDITTPRNAAQIRFDGRDKIASTRGFALVSGGFPVSNGSVIAGTVSAYDTSKFGTDYVVPVGQDTPFPTGSSPAFETTSIIAMASQDNTTVEIDADADGTFETSGVIDEGEVAYQDGGVLEGARVRSDKPIQVHLATGDVGSAFESRWFTLFPTEVLSSDYLNPVGSGLDNERTIVYLFNPGTAAITVTPTCTSCSGTITVPAGASASFVNPLNQAVRFASNGGEPFTAIGGVGAQSGGPPASGADQSTAHDWGYTLIPTSQLTSQAVLSWAPGNSIVPPSTPGAGNFDDDPVWITSLTATTLYVDFDGNPSTGSIPGVGNCTGNFDRTIAVGALVSTRIFDNTDGDMTGARIAACDGTPIAGAWGEDPVNAPAGSPGFDAGYTLIPSTTMVLDKTASLANDTNGDGFFGPGDTVEYEVAIADAGSLAFTNVVMDDALVPGTSYVPGSAEYEDANGNITPVADDIAPPASTVYPFDETGAPLPDIPAGTTVFVRFQLVIDRPWQESVNSLTNFVQVTANEASANDTVVTPLVESDLSLTKVLTSTPTFVGQNATYRITVSNAGLDAADDVEVTDVVPTGTTFVSATPSIGSYNSGTGVWTIPSIANGGSVTLDLTVRVDQTSVTNVAQVTSSGSTDPDSQPDEDPLGPTDPPNQDDEATVPLTVSPRADLSLTKTVVSGPTPAGDVTFRLTLTNDGPSTATGTQVTDLPPAGATFQSATPATGSFNGGTNVWSVPTLASGASTTLDVVYRIGTYPTTNLAQVTTAGQADVDSQPAENPLGPSNPPDQDDEATVSVAALSDLELSKIASTVTFAGETVTYTLTLVNNGPTPATGVQVTDQLPAGLTFVSATPSVGTYSSVTGIWNVGTIASTATQTLTIDAVVNAVGSYTNTAEVTASSSPDPDSTPDNDDPSEDDQDSVTTTVGGTTIGDRVWYDIDGDGVQELGEPGIPGVDLDITWAGPDGTFGTGDDVTTTATTDSLGTWAVGGLSGGQHRVTVDTATLPAGMTAPTFDLNGIGTPNTTTLTVTPGVNRTNVDFGYTGTGSVGDLVFVDADLDNTADAGEGVDGVDVTAVWAGFDGTLGTADDITYPTTTTAGGGAYSFTRLPAGPISVTVDPAGLPANSVASIDPDGGNDDTATVTLTAGQTRNDQDFGYDPGRVDLSIVKSDSGASVTAGSTVTYTLTYENGTNANQPATGVVVTETVPANTTFVAASSTAGWSCADGAPAGTTCTFAVPGTLGIGQSGSIGFAVRLSTAIPAGTTIVTNTASIEDDGTHGPDPDPSDDTDDEPTPIVAAPDLRASKTDGGASVSPGGVVTYTVGYSNVGTRGATGVVLTETVPTNATFSTAGSTLGWSCADGAPAGSTCTLAVSGAVAVGGSGSATFAVRAVFPIGGAVTQLANTVSVADDGTNGTDPTPADNSASDTTPLQRGTLGDRIFFDVDGDGTDDPGDPGIPGVDVDVTWPGPDGTFGNGDDVTVTVTTASDGSWSATGLPAGQLRVTVDTAMLPAGMTAPTADPDGGSDNRSTVTLPAGGTNNAQDFGYTGTGSVGDLVFVDADLDDTADAGEGVDGVDVTAVWAGFDGTLGTADDITYPATTTAGGGLYTFTRLPAGPVSVTVDPAGLPANSVASIDPDGGNDDTATSTLTAGQARTDQDFGYDPGRVDLSIVKSDSGASVTAGSTVTYTLTYENGTNANQPATGVVLTETVPANTTFSSAGSTAGWSCANGAPAGTTCTFAVPGTVGIGQSGSVTFAVRLGTTIPAGTTVVTNTASIEDDGTHGPDPDPSDDTDDEPTPIVAAPDLVVTKDDGGASVSPGGVVSYTLDYSNVGTRGATGVVLTETVPANSRFSTAGSTFGWSCADGAPAGTTCTLSVGSLPVGASGSATFAVRAVFPIGGAVTQLSNTVSVADDGTNGTEPTPADNTDTDTTPIARGSLGDRIFFDVDGDGTDDAGEPGIPGVDVDVTWPGPDGTFGTGDDVTVTVTTGADGSWTATGLPAGDLRVTVDTATLPAGMTAPTADPDGGADSTSEVTLPAGGTDTDQDFGYTGTGSVGDLVFVDADLDGTADAGEGVGGVDVTAVWAGFDGTLGTADDITYPADTTSAAGAYSFTRLPAGDVSITIDPATLPANAVASIDPDGGNDDTATVALGAGETRTDQDFGYDPGRVDLSIVKSDAGASVTPGSVLTYTLTYENGTNANQPATGVLLTETVPANTTFVAASSTAGWSCANGSPAGTSCTFSVPGTVGIGQGGSVTFAVRLAASVPSGTATVSNTASIEDDGTHGPDPDPSDDTDEEPTPIVAAPDLVASKTDGGASVSPGGVVTYTVGYSNVGNRGATGVVLTETVPANATFDAAGSTFGWSCTDGAPAGSTCTFAVAGTVAAGGSGSAAFAVRAVFPIGGAVTQLSNTVSVADDGANGTDPTPANNSATDTTPLQRGTLGDRIFFDVDGDGTDDAGEPGIPGVDVDVTWPGPDGTFGNGDDVTVTVTTGADGSWTATGLPAGDLRVTVDTATLPGGLDDPTADPDGGADSTSDVTLPAGGTDTDQDFGYTGTGTVGDLVFLDADLDGTADAGEGIAGVDVTAVWAGFDGTLGTADDITYPADTTSAAGAYSFTRLPAGDVSITIDPATLPANAVASIDPDGGNDDTATVDLGAGETRNDQDFGYDPGQVDLSIVKTDADVTVNPGGLITYSLAYENGPAANQPATGVVLTETVPANTTFVAAGSAVGWSCADGAPAGSTCTLNVGTVNIGQAAAATFVVRVDLAVPAGTTVVTNTASIEDDGTHGPDPDPSDDTDDEPTPLSGAPDLSVSKTDGDASVAPGNVVVYTLAFANNGNRGASGVVLTETVPANATFEATGSTFGWSCADGAPAGTVCSLALGTVQATDIGVATFAVRADYPLPQGVTQLDNEVSIGDDGANGTDPTPDDNIATDSTPTAPGTLGDSVFTDTNDNGAADAGEGIAGVDVDITWAGPDGTFGNGDDVTVTVTTDADGTWTATGLPAGELRVTVDTATLPPGLSNTVDPDGGDDDTADVTLTAGESNLAQDFGYRGTGGIGDSVFSDTDGDGVQDPGEPGLGNVLVTLLQDVDGDGTYETTVDAVLSAGSGAYFFPNLPAGDYRVVVTPPVGLDPSTPTTVDVTLAGNETRDDVDFGLVPPAPPEGGTIGDTVFDDADGDGVQDSGETGVAGATVTLLADQDLDGSYETELATQLTGADGTYSFGNLPPANYQVVLTVPTGLSATTPTAVPVTLTAGEVVDTADFGVTDATPAPGSIGDTVFDDADGDGVQDAGEPGLPGVTVTVRQDTDGDGIFETVVDTLTTDTDGGYLADGLDPGSYSVTVTPTTGTTPTTPTTVLVPLSAGEDVDTVDFGLSSSPVPNGSISGRVWGDVNRDQNQDTDEPGVNVVTVRLLQDTDGDGVFETEVDSIDSSGNGDYTFTNVPPGRYSVVVDPPDGQAVTTAGSYTVDVDPGEDVTDIDFGLATPAAVPFDLELTKDAEGDAEPGGTITWVLTVRNNGIIPAPLPLVVTDTLPDGLTFQGFSGAGWSCTADGSILTCELPQTLGVGASVELRVTTLVSDGIAAGAVLENVAVVSSNGIELTLANNGDDALSTIQAPPATTTTTTAAPTTTVPPRTIPRTGNKTVPWTGLAFSCLAAGLAFLGLRREVFLRRK